METRVFRKAVGYYIGRYKFRRCCDVVWWGSYFHCFFCLEEWGGRLSNDLVLKDKVPTVNEFQDHTLCWNRELTLHTKTIVNGLAGVARWKTINQRSALCTRWEAKSDVSTQGTPIV